MSYSQEIRNWRGGVFDNPWQGKDKKVVFVCSMGILRSATAARIYAHKYNTRAAGSWSDALVPLTEDLIMWAEEIVFVNDENYLHVLKDMPELQYFIHKKARVLSIPDSHAHMDPILIQAFEDQYEPL